MSKPLSILALAHIELRPYTNRNCVLKIEHQQARHAGKPIWTIMYQGICTYLWHDSRGGGRVFMRDTLSGEIIVFWIMQEHAGFIQRYTVNDVNPKRQKKVTRWRQKILKNVFCRPKGKTLPPDPIEMCGHQDFTF